MKGRLQVSKPSDTGRDERLVYTVPEAGALLFGAIAVFYVLSSSVFGREEVVE